MNGYHLDDFKDFTKSWTLVTVRFREDTREMRFTYANDIAMKALNSKSKEYPDGSIFGKVALISEVDPAFTSSMVPSGARRYQFMVKNRKKFKDTDGWGFVLFDAAGNIYPEKQETQTIACLACHRLVSHVGGIFSKPLTLSPYARTKESAAESKVLSTGVKFENLNYAELSDDIKAHIPKDIKLVRQLKGKLEEAIFQGTLDEIRPVLSEEVFKTNLPALLISKSKNQYSVVYLDKLKECDRGKGMHAFWSVMGERKPLELTYCYGEASK